MKRVGDNLDANTSENKIQRTDSLTDSQIRALADPIFEGLGAPAEGNRLSQEWLFSDQSPTFFTSLDELTFEKPMDQHDYNTPPFISVLSGSQFDSQDLDVKKHAVIHTATRCSTHMEQLFCCGKLPFMPTVNKGLYNAHKIFCLSILADLEQSDFLKGMLESIQVDHSNGSPSFLLSQLEYELKNKLNDQDLHAVKSLDFSATSFYEMERMIQDEALDILWSAIKPDEGVAQEVRLSANDIRSWMDENKELLDTVESLDLGASGLKCIPPEIGRLTELEELILSSNEISVIPPEIGCLSKLKGLTLSSNKISVIPPEVGSLIILENLFLEDNAIKQLPPELIALHDSLEELHLNGNKFTEIPEILRAMSTLKYLWLEDNQIKASEPTPAEFRGLLYFCR